MDMMIDAHGGYKIDGIIFEGQFHERWLLICLKGRMRGEHAGRRITPDRLREIAARNFQQLTPATADIQPPLRPQSHAGSLQERFDQEPFPAVEMERILRESIPDWIIE
jgi:hypothetical protein